MLYLLRTSAASSRLVIMSDGTDLAISLQRPLSHDECLLKIPVSCCRHAKRYPSL